MAQFARPDSDIADGGFTTTPLWSKIDESVADDGDLITSPAGLGTAELGLSTVTDPEVGTGHIVRVRYKRGSGSGNLQSDIMLFDGATQIWSVTLTITNASYVDGSWTLTEAEANNITDYSDLRLKFDDTNDTRYFDVSFAELEVPDAPAGGPTLPPQRAMVGVGQ